MRPSRRPWTRRAAAAVAALAFAATPLAADQGRLLARDREAAEARVEMALGAERELFASAFIFGDDPFTLTSLALVRDTARRGVVTRLLVDAQWNRVPRPVLAHLVAEGVAIREFHRFRFDRLGWILRRMHDKLLIIDGREVIAGGRNVESTYYGLGRQAKRRNYVDLDLRVRGAAAAAARDYFERVWRSRHVSEVRPRATAAEIAAAAHLVDVHEAWLDAQIAAALDDPERRPAELLEIGPVEFLHDPIGDKTESDDGVGPGLRDLLGAARESVLVESPYLIPSRALRRSLDAALARGVRIRILTNSLAATDNLWAQAGYVGRRRELVDAGLELWEYAGPECLHAKAAVIDGETVVVGSYNLDPRSERLNSETALVVRHRGLATELSALFDEHLEKAWRIDDRGWPEGAKSPFPGVPRARICKLRLMRLLVPFVKGQL